MLFKDNLLIISEAKIVKEVNVFSDGPPVFLQVSSLLIVLAATLNFTNSKNKQALPSLFY